MTNKVEEAMTYYWGERCSDHEGTCPTCQAWVEYDALAASGFGRLFNAQELKELKEIAVPMGDGNWLIPRKK